MDELLLPFHVIRDIAFITILFGIALYVISTRGFDYYSKRGVKHFPPVPIVGNLGSYLSASSSPCEIVKRTYDAFPDQKFVGHYNFKAPCLIIRDPDLIRQVLVRDFEYFSEHTFFVDEEIDPLFGKNLFVLRGDKWRAMRTTLSPAFTNSKVARMFPLLGKCCENLMQYVDEKLEDPGKLLIEGSDFFGRFTYHVIASVALGVEIDTFTNDDSEFFKMARKATNFEGIAACKVVMLPYFPRLSKFLQMKMLDDSVSKFFLKLIHDTISSREANNTVRHDMIQLLIQAKKGTLNDDDLGVTATRNKDLTDEDIASQAMIFLVAGCCNSTTLISFAAYEIAKNPEVQEKLLAEIDSLKKTNPNDIAYEEIDKMEYLEMIISETLRKWPPSDIDRVCVKPYLITDKKNNINYEMRIDESILVPIYAIHRDPNYFPDPDKFDPERFSKSRKECILPNTYIPFGIGPRKCIGIHFSLILAKLVIFHILSKFTIRVSPKTDDPIELATTIFLKSKNGLWLNLHSRDNLS